jgi:GDPmannose 4,6-dehydratase
MNHLPPRNGKRALITGITGQDGSYLGELLIRKGYEVWGMVRRSSVHNVQQLRHFYQDPHQADVRLHLRYGDLNDGSSIHDLLQQVRPDEIYNLGAQSHVQVSFEMPEYTCEVTGLGPLRILEAMRQLGLQSRFYQASSSEIFGRTSTPMQNEDTPFQPRSPYGVAKACAFHLTRNYREAHGMFAVNGILFNHESPRRGETFVTRKITRAVGRIVAGLQQQLYLGNLDARRDWGFAGDYVHAMWQMLQLDEPEDFVISTGETHSVREFCRQAFDRGGLPLRWEGEGLQQRGVDAEGNVRVAVDRRFFRPAEIDTLCGDSSKARQSFGWKPQVTFQQLVDMMVDHDLELARRERAEQKRDPGHSLWDR